MAIYWMRTADVYPDTRYPDCFTAFDDAVRFPRFHMTEGDEYIGGVRRIEHGPQAGLWQWTMTVSLSGPRYGSPTNGIEPTRGTAAHDRSVPPLPVHEAAAVSALAVATPRIARPRRRRGRRSSGRFGWVFHNARDRGGALGSVGTFAGTPGPNNCSCFRSVPFFVFGGGLRPRRKFHREQRPLRRRSVAQPG